jgi:hypothetical protein
MAERVTSEEIAEAIYQVVKETTGVRKLRPVDLMKMMTERFGPERCSKDVCKEAIRRLMDSGRCIYTSYGGTTYVEIPSGEGSET